jgi:integrase
MIEVSPRKRSAHTEISRIKALIRRPIAHRPLASLSSADLATYRAERLKAVSSSTVIRELNTLSHAIDTAMRDWNVYLHRNPCKLVRRPSPPRGRNRRLTGDEEQLLLDAADTGRNIYMRDLIVLAIETGMRRGELLSLDWVHVDLEQRIAHLPLTKNGDPRDVPLSSRAREVLQRVWEAQGSPLVGRALPTSESAVCQAWGHLCGRAGISGLHFHDLRHEAVSRLFEKGLNVIKVGTISGHKELRMLARYAHLKAVDLVDRLG